MPHLVEGLNNLVAEHTQVIPNAQLQRGGQQGQVQVLDVVLQLAPGVLKNVPVDQIQFSDGNEAGKLKENILKF